MFYKRYNFIIEDAEVVNFVRLLGRFGLRFEISDLKSKVDRLDPNRRVWFREFTVIAKRKEMDNFFNAVNILAKYRMH